VEIGDNTRICRCVDIVSGIPERFQKGRKDFEVPTIIGKNVYLGHQAIVYAGVKVGDNAIVYHGAVVQKDVPSGAIVKGNPAKVVGWVGKKAKKYQKNPNIYIPPPPTLPLFRRKVNKKKSKLYINYLIISISIV
jgi:acetyltransferase-like isoleucine patch superfamily enzyme